MSSVSISSTNMSDLTTTPTIIIADTNLTPIKQDNGEFSDTVIEISEIAMSLQQSETQKTTSKEIEKIADEVVRVSSTIGRARSQGNLSAEQAAALYSKIAQLL